jgi:allophanate hydrolase subunit 2
MRPNLFVWEVKYIQEGKLKAGSTDHRIIWNLSKLWDGYHGTIITNCLERKWKISRREDRSGKRLKRKDCGKREQAEGFSSTERCAEFETIRRSRHNA